MLGKQCSLLLFALKVEPFEKGPSSRKLYSRFQFILQHNCTLLIIIRIYMRTEVFFFDTFTFVCSNLDGKLLKKKMYRINTLPSENYTNGFDGYRQEVFEEKCVETPLFATDASTHRVFENM